MRKILSFYGVLPKLQRIAKLAREKPGVALTTLAHHIDYQFLYAAYLLTRKDGAVGADGQTAEEYKIGLRERLESLLDRFKSGTYRAPAVRRVQIPKGDGKRTRPIGIPTFEDKILQRAVAMVLGAVYEQDFLDCSYGFRPGRSAHQALDRLWKGLMEMGLATVIELDIQSFFDCVDWGHLRSFLDQRVRDGVLRRMIDKWLKAGVLEDGETSYPEFGTPQGGVASPLLANIYLHEVLDRWFEQTVKPRLQGRAFLVRYADDAVLVFSSPRDARRVMDALPKRFGKYGLTLHPEKTRMIEFRPPRPQQEGGGSGFDFLGFTHYWGRSRKGRWVVKRKTASQRLTRAIKSVALWCKRYRHLPVREQHQTLVLKLRGHCAYYGVIGNSESLARFRHEMARSWQKWLNRRSQRLSMRWDRFRLLLKRHPLTVVRAVPSVYGQAAKL